MFCVLTGMLDVLPAQAQTQTSTHTINATIVDEDGRALSGILVNAFNSNDKAFTDSEGNISLEVERERDRLVIDANGYKFTNLVVKNGNLQQDSIQLTTNYPVDGSNEVGLPYNTFSSDRSVSATYTISGEELAKYPTSNLLEALSGKMPGVTVNDYGSVPGDKSVGVSIRGSGAAVYVDGIRRDASNLSPHEVDKVQVIKDMSGRAALGVSGASPILWITTKKGKGTGEVNVSTEYGMSTPTVLPKYLDSYNYAVLHNEALENDGQDPAYDQQALNAYQNNSDPLRYPDVDYYDRYMRDFTSFRKANVNFSGGGDDLNYFTMVDYNGSSGLENVGEQANANRYRMRGNISYQINDWIGMNVNLGGTYQQQTFPNVGDGATPYNIFQQVLSVYPPNAHPITYEDKLMVSSDYPVNLTNELRNSGYGESVDISSQNDASLMLDLDQFIKGLSFMGTASFNIYNTIGIGKGGTAELFRFTGDTIERYQEQSVDPNMDLGNQYQSTRTVGKAQLNYDRQFGDHALTLDGSFFRAEDEGGGYQPEKLIDYSFRANYAFDKRYIVQFDASYSGSMKLPKGKRFDLYPSAGVAWVVSNEAFLQESKTVNYLKVFASLGEMGIHDFFIYGYNPYYLSTTLWESAGAWWSGIPGSSGSTNIYRVMQTGTEDYELPTRQYFNLGVQSRLLDNKLSMQLNYFREKNTGLLSSMENVTSALMGGQDFLPALNYEENMSYGIDGMISFNNTVGDFSYGVGANAMYLRREYVTVDEAAALEEYRKRAGKDMDLMWLYESDGLFQSQDEIDSRDVEQSWGTLQPGDIRYVDYNNDGVVDEKDIHTTGAHSPRLFYGVNLSVGYKGLNLAVQGEGVADGQTQLSNSRYFKINGTQQKYSELMLDRWPNTDNYPRLTTSSQNNMQGSTFWLENAAYFRIKNVELSYTLPDNLAQSVLMDEVRLFVRGRNMFVFSELNQYNIDPEDQNAGIYRYPMLQTVTGGVSVKF